MGASPRLTLSSASSTGIVYCLASTTPSFSIKLEEVEKLVEQSKTLETIIYLDYNTLLYMEDIDVLNDYVVDVVTNKTYSFELLDISYEVLGVINKNVV